MNEKVRTGLLHKAYLLVVVSLTPLVLQAVITATYLQRTHGYFWLQFFCYGSIAYSLFKSFFAAYFFAANTLRKLHIVRLNLENITNGKPLIPAEKDFFSDEVTSLMKAVYEFGSKHGHQP